MGRRGMRCVLICAILDSTETDLISLPWYVQTVQVLWGKLFLARWSAQNFPSTFGRCHRSSLQWFVRLAFVGRGDIDIVEFTFIYWLPTLFITAYHSITFVLLRYRGVRGRLCDVRLGKEWVSADVTGGMFNQLLLSGQFCNERDRETIIEEMTQVSCKTLVLW